MIDLGPHASFILTAYFGAALVVVGLIVATMLDTRRQKARLAALEARGVHRRSSQKGTGN